MDRESIQIALEAIPEWSLDMHALLAEYTFADFSTAFEFMKEVATEAEAQNHHPEWNNIYNQVSFILSTHEAGDVVTQKDLDLARAIHRISADFM